MNSMHDCHADASLLGIVCVKNFSLLCRLQAFLAGDIIIISVIHRVVYNVSRIYTRISEALLENIKMIRKRKATRIMKGAVLNEKVVLCFMDVII